MTEENEAVAVEPVVSTVCSKPKWWEDRVDEMFVGLIVGVISCISVFVLEDKSVPVVTGAISVLGMYMVGKPRTNGNGGG